MAVGVVAQGLSIFDTLRKSLATNGSLQAAGRQPDNGSAGTDHGGISLARGQTADKLWLDYKSPGDRQVPGTT